MESNIIYVILHDYGTERFLKYETILEYEAIVELEKWESEVYKEYGNKSDDNYVWLKSYDLNDINDKEEYENLRNY